MAEQRNPKSRPPTRLNDLPEDLLIHILTFLPILKVIQTSFISRQWRNRWHLMQTLKLNQEEDDPLFTRGGEYDVRFSNTISGALANRPKSNPLRVFQLYCLYCSDHRYRHGHGHHHGHRHRSSVTTWIRYALDCNVEDMSLVFEDGYDDETRYPFHFIDIKNRPLRCLTLSVCEIVLPHEDSIQFDSLRVLRLSCVKINDESLTDLISRCNILEELCLYGVDGLRIFKIHSKSLKILELRSCENGGDDSSMEIHAPNLSEIKVEDFDVVNYAANLSSLKVVMLRFENNLERCWGNVMHLNMLRGVECLKIKELFPRCVLPKFNSDPRFQFERLRHLEIQAGFTLDDILGVCVLLKRAPGLESLVITDSGRSINEESLSEEFNHLALELRIPCLLEVKMIGFRNTKFEHGILLLLWKHGKVLNKVLLVPHATLGKPTTVLDPTSNDFIKLLVERRIG